METLQDLLETRIDSTKYRFVCVENWLAPSPTQLQPVWPGENSKGKIFPVKRFGKPHPTHTQPAHRTGSAECVTHFAQLF
jgi:hypothetical protein